MKVFIFAGQSNSGGYGKRGQLSPVPSWAQTTANGWEGHPTQSSDNGVEYLHPTLANFPCLYAEFYGKPLVDVWGRYLGESKHLADAYHPTDYYLERDLYGPDVSFMWRWRQDNPTESAAVLKYAIGGTSIADWSPPTGGMWVGFLDQLNKAKARLSAAGLSYEFAGFIFGHGESGCSTVYPYLHPTAGQEYKDKLRALLVAVRANTRSDLPCVIARIGSQMLAPAVIGTYSSGEDTPANREAATYYRRAQQVEVGSDPGNVWYDRDGLPTNTQETDPSQRFHTTGAGYLADGERAYAALTGWTPPPPPAPLVVKFNGAIKPDWDVKLNGNSIGGNDDVIDVTGTL